LLIADKSKSQEDKRAVLRYVSVHRHVRGQYFTNPNFTAHFSVFCLASGGSDQGNYAFEVVQMNEHINIHPDILRKRFDDANLRIRLFLKADSDQFASILQSSEFVWMDKVVELEEDFTHAYYQTFQFKIFLKRDDQEMDLADGGMVDWTQKLLENRKQRLLISGLGMELVEKFSRD
jgi:hypothetical protein